MAREDRPVGGEIYSMDVGEARSALSWWLEAGVDSLVQENPRNWLRPAPPPAMRGDVAPIANLAEPTQESLAELRDWLASSAQVPLAATAARRILPHGPEQASIMLLSDMPALEDAAAGQPIGGDAWTLILRMLAAVGISADDAYSASLACISAPGARLAPAEREACATIARHHIRLAAPKRLLLLGEGPAQTLLGKSLPQARAHVHKVEGVRSCATFHPRQLIQNPANKSYAWKDLLLLMEDDG
jgi:DNA polymerase